MEETGRLIEKLVKHLHSIDGGLCGVEETLDLLKEYGLEDLSIEYFWEEEYTEKLASGEYKVWKPRLEYNGYINETQVINNLAFVWAGFKLNNCLSHIYIMDRAGNKWGVAYSPSKIRIITKDGEVINSLYTSIVCPEFKGINNTDITHKSSKFINNYFTAIKSPLTFKDLNPRYKSTAGDIIERLLEKADEIDLKILDENSQLFEKHCKDLNIHLQRRLLNDWMPEFGIQSGKRLGFKDLIKGWTITSTGIDKSLLDKENTELGEIMATELNRREIMELLTGSVSPFIQESLLTILSRDVITRGDVERARDLVAFAKKKNDLYVIQLPLTMPVRIEILWKSENVFSFGVQLGNHTNYISTLNLPSPRNWKEEEIKEVIELIEYLADRSFKSSKLSDELRINKEDLRRMLNVSLRKVFQ